MRHIWTKYQSLETSFMLLKCNNMHDFLGLTPGHGPTRRLVSLPFIHLCISSYAFKIICENIIMLQINGKSTIYVTIFIANNKKTSYSVSLILCEWNPLIAAWITSHRTSNVEKCHVVTIKIYFAEIKHFYSHNLTNFCCTGYFKDALAAKKQGENWTLLN